MPVALFGWTMAVKGCGTPLPLDTAARLVLAGPYRYVRNPMAVGGLAQGFAVSLWLGSWLTAGYVLSGLLFWQVLVRPIEERELADRFGEPYEDYRKAVRCWWPRIPG